MRLVSFRAPGDDAGGPWRAGVVTDGRVVDARDCGGPDSVRALLALEPARLAAVGDAAAGRDGVAREDVVLGPPVPDPDKILCIGLNYADHAEETKLDASAVPTVFTKFRNSLVGHEAAIVVPAAATQVDFEGELGVVIGRRCRRVSEADALAAVGGVMPLDDVSARDLQFQTSQWTPGKAVDTFAPCGPELVVGPELPDLAGLHLRTLVNDVVVQDARTDQMLFDIPRIIAYLSSFLTLEIGDVIATGTPAGVGFTREPPLLLDAGDVVEVDIEGVGRLRNTVEREE